MSGEHSSDFFSTHLYQAAYKQHQNQSLHIATRLSYPKGNMGELFEPMSIGNGAHTSNEGLSHLRDGSDAVPAAEKHLRITMTLIGAINLAFVIFIYGDCFLFDSNAGYAWSPDREFD